jgi:hypothetical protein
MTNVQSKSNHGFFLLLNLVKVLNVSFAESMWMDISMKKYRQKMKKRIENFEIEKCKGILENIKQGSKEKTTKYFY